MLLVLSLSSPNMRASFGRPVGKKARLLKIISKSTLHEKNQTTCDLNYWLGRSGLERLAAVEYLRSQYYGSSTGIQRTAKVIRGKQY